MNSYCICPDEETVSDNPLNKFKVTNEHGDGHELGSGIMELTDTELILYTCKGDPVKSHYLCFFHYGYDSNIFSFESDQCTKLDKESLPLNVPVQRSCLICCKR